MEHFFPPTQLFTRRSSLSALRAMEPLFASAGLGVWHLDIEAGRLWWSKRTREIHEAEPQFRPDPLSAIAFYAPEARAAIVETIRSVQLGGTSWDIILPVITARGREIAMRSCGLTVVEDGSTKYILGICQDLTQDLGRAKEHAQLALVVEQMTNAAVIADREGRTVWVNAAFERLTGYNLTDFAGKKPGGVLQGPGTDPETVRAISTALRKGEPFSGEILNYKKDGQAYWIEIEVSAIRDPEGTITGFVAIESDASARREAQLIAARELEVRREAETLLRDILDTVPTAISAFDRSNRLVVVNQMKKEILPQCFSTLKPGMQLADVLRGFVEHEEQMSQNVASVEERVTDLVEASETCIAPVETQLNDGRWLLSAARRSASGNLIWVRTDITDIKAAELEAHNRANRDSLTGLLNRNGFFGLLKCIIAQRPAATQRLPPSGCLTVFDIDHFKSVNDVYGHEAGDILLRTIARRLQRNVRVSDIVARLGGDEFALFMPDTGIDDAQQRLEAVSVALCRMTRLNTTRLQPSISMGLAPVITGLEDCDELLRRADRAAYEAKRRGRGRIVLYTDHLAGELSDRRRLADRLHHALASDKVEVAVQPQLQLRDGTIPGFEALARWNDGSQWVPPAAFVAAAEMHGLAEKLGRSVMRKALAACKTLREASGTEITIGVNVGTGQLLSDSFAEQVIRDLAEIGLPPSALELELTETVLLDRSFARIEPGLSHLRSLGVRLALDDFGTGHASLTHLGALNIDRLKIDRSFVAAIGIDKRRELIARTIVGLACGLKLDCVAEGVETEDQRRFLEEHGCSHLQGFLVGRPMQIDQASTWLVDHCEKRLIR